MLRNLYIEPEAYPPTGSDIARSLAPLIDERPLDYPVGQPRQKTRFPWDGQPDADACYSTLRHFLHHLPLWLEVDGRVHAETCLAASGVIAGFAAQYALIAHLAATSDVETFKQIRTVRTIKRGEFFFGEPLDRTLLPVSKAEADSKLWPLAAGAAVSAGLHPSRLPNTQQMFANVANTLGGPREGIPHVPRQYAPKLPAKALLETIWPETVMCFKDHLPDATNEFGVDGVRHWPAIAAHLASTLIRQTRSAVDPRAALVIVMESAIYASKLTPSTLKIA